jgi:predicted nucleic acid-binding protein
LPVVVADAGPLIHLAQIGKLHLVQRLFGQVTITASVKREAVDEGVRLGYADAEVIGGALRDGWIVVESVPSRLAKSAEKLALGENISVADAETLLLAKEKRAELLVDEKIVSDLAKMYGLRVWGTWTLLLESLSMDLIEVADVENAVNDLGRKKFRLNAKQVKEILDAAKFIEKRRAPEKSKRKKWGKGAFLDAGETTFGE